MWNRSRTATAGYILPRAALSSVCRVQVTGNGDISRTVADPLATGHVHMTRPVIPSVTKISTTTGLRLIHTNYTTGLLLSAA